MTNRCSTPKITSCGIQPTATTPAIAIMTPDQASPVANQRPQNHSATTAKNATP